MKRYLITLAAGLLVLGAATSAYAQSGDCCLNSCNPCGGQKWSFWARTNSCAPANDCDEARWQKFWCDYYRALACYYKRLDRLDWVIYYKFHGYQTGGGQCMPMGPGNCGYYQARPQYAPVFVAPQMQWGVVGAGCNAQGCASGWNCSWPGCK
jgi:hypothetical protein